MVGPATPSQVEEATLGLAKDLVDSLEGGPSSVSATSALQAASERLRGAAGRVAGMAGQLEKGLEVGQGRRESGRLHMVQGPCRPACVGRGSC